MNVKEINELDTLELNENTLVLVYNENDGAGKAYLTTAKEALSQIDDLRISLKNTLSAKKIHSLIENQKEELETSIEGITLTAGENIEIEGKKVSMPTKFTKVKIVDTKPELIDAEEYVLYLVNTIQDVYTGYYLIIKEDGTKSWGQIGGRSYTGGEGITIDEDTATITNKLSTSGGTINGDLTIEGNIYQKGESYTTEAEIVKSKNDFIILREGAESALVDGDYTGFEAKNYNGKSSGILAFDNSGTARVGDYSKETGIDDTQALATRQDNPADQSLMKWNAEKKTLESTNLSENGVSTHIENQNIHVTEQQKTEWNGKLTSVELKWAEYQALSDEEKKDPSKLYLITDKQGTSSLLIDDSRTSTETAWSSKKVSDEIGVLSSPKLYMHNLYLERFNPDIWLEMGVLMDTPDKLNSLEGFNKVMQKYKWFVPVNVQGDGFSGLHFLSPDGSPPLYEGFFIDMIKPYQLSEFTTFSDNVSEF